MGIVIAFSGWAGSGKDASASYLVEKGFTRVSFADELKNSVSKQYNLPLDMFHNTKKKDSPLLEYPVVVADKTSQLMVDILSKELYSDGNVSYWTPRAILILEAAAKRAVNINHWSEIVVNLILDNPDRNFCVSDLRYLSEVSHLSEMLGDNLVTVRVNRFLSSPNTVASERELDDYKFDYTIENKGSLEQLYTSIDKILEKEANKCFII